jgi:hypothetical protein
MNQVFYHCATAPLYARRKEMLSVPLLVFSSRFCSYRKPNFPAISGSYLNGFSGRICSYWQPNFPTVSGSYLPGFSGHICSYWQPNFPAVSAVTCRDFLALPFLAPEGRDFPAVSVVSGRDFSRQIVLVSTAGFSVLNTGIFWREAETKRLFSQYIYIYIYTFYCKTAKLAPFCVNFRS